MLYITNLTFILNSESSIETLADIQPRYGVVPLLTVVDNIDYTLANLLAIETQTFPTFLVASLIQTAFANYALI